MGEVFSHTNLYLKLICLFTFCIHDYSTLSSIATFAYLMHAVTNPSQFPKSDIPACVSDFGIVLGCKIYVKEITSRSAAAAAAGAELQEGDVILRINQQPASDGMTLKEARKLLEAARDRVQLLVRRESGGRAEDAKGGLHSRRCLLCGIVLYYCISKISVAHTSIVS